MKRTLLILIGSLFSLITFAQSQRSLNAFSKVSFAEKPFTLTGMFKGYDPAIDSFKYCSVIYNHLYKRNQQTHTGEIDKTGKFSITFPLNRPQEIMFEFMDRLILFYAVPGSTLDISFDLPAFKVIEKLDYPDQLKTLDPLVFSGPYAQLNKECNLFKPVEHRNLLYIDHYPMIDSLDQMAYKTYRMGIMQRLLDSLAAFNNKYNTSSEFRQLLTQHIRYNTAEDLLRYRWMHNMKKKERAYVELTPAYLSFLNDMPLNNEEAVISQSYSSFLKEYTNMYRITRPYKVDFPAFLMVLKNAGKQLSPLEEQLLKPVEGLPTPESRKLYDSVFKEYKSQISDYISLQRFTDGVDTLAAATSSGTGKDIMLTGLIIDHLYNDRMPLTALQLDTLARKIANNNLRTQIAQDNDRLKNILAGNMPAGSHLRSSLQVSEDKFFEELIRPYKGKVVYIDFWAPWCGPCMSEMPSSKKLQQEVAGKDIVFLYIGISCSKQSWENTIKERSLEGEHYYANDNEGKLLSGKFNISGIPHYVLIDKEGKVKDDHAPRPSDKTKLLRRINELLK